MSSKINLQTCEYACKSSIFQDNQLIYFKLFIGKLFHRLIQPRRRPVGHDADGGSVLILLGAVTILIKLL